jgi:hypothetical protein
MVGAVAGGLLAGGILVCSTGTAIANSHGTANGGGNVITSTGELRTECWQHGTKVLDVEGLTNLNMGSQTREDSLSFRRRGKAGIAVVIVPMGDGLCLVTSPD